MRDPFISYGNREGAAIAYAVFSIFAGVLCLFVGLLMFPFWFGVGFAIVTSVFLILAFAALHMHGRNNNSGPSGESEFLRRIEPSQVQGADEMRSHITRCCEEQKGQKKK
ncbi:hypothetical protein [Pseudotabrizicola alkalilacus]|uniref:hypothetical protein n=1 Tax=Pseudotabrizicola alkalilacus TaxID=2305252 RepID=UPI0011C139C5|nr:hypothetical protein [Pseudotabrizicola alkalilacus]